MDESALTEQPCVDILNFRIYLPACFSLLDDILKLIIPVLRTLNLPEGGFKRTCFPLGFLPVL
ncbi:hypothetical protein KY363_04255 [Candidatus Woesearchaeota archaeon]|nr:hypothetical protein [Candidatus Woesearchaeota archaeon]